MLGVGCQIPIDYKCLGCLKLKPKSLNLKDMAGRNISKNQKFNQMKERPERLTNIQVSKLKKCETCIFFTKVTEFE